MTPKQYAVFKRELTDFQRSPGYDLEQRLNSVEVIRHTFTQNAVELEGALVAFRDSRMHPLMHQENRDKLHHFLLLVTRRLYNHLATAVSVAEHLRTVAQAMPHSLQMVREQMLQEIEAFAGTSNYRVLVTLRNHGSHHQLHLTTAQMTLHRVDEKADPHQGWQMSTTILLDVETVRRAATDRRRRKRRERYPDPLLGLSETVDLLSLVNESQAATAALVGRLKAVLLAEYARHEAEVTATRERLRKMHDA